MKGIGRTAYQLLCWTPLQRYLIAVGLPVAVLALATLAWQPHFERAPPGLLGLLAVLGITSVAFVPASAGGWLFRYLCAARAIGLIPRGRLKLLLGALLTQALVAILITLLLCASSVATGAAPIYAGVFAALSAQFLMTYYAAPLDFAAPALGLIYILAPRFMSFAFPDLTIRDVIGSGIGEACLLAVAAFAWLTLAATVLRSRLIAAPRRDASTASALQFRGRPRANRDRMSQLDRPRAIQALLTGSFGTRRLTIVIALGCAFVFALAFFVAPFRYSVWNPGQHFPMGLPFVLLGLACGTAAYPLMGRTRSLWLIAGLNRPALFRAVEAQSWRVLMIMTGLTLALTVTLSIFAPLPHTTVVWMLLTPPAVGATMIYLALLWIRGRELADLPIIAVVILIWLGDLAAVLTNTGGSLPFELLGAQLCLAPVLRALAYSRWKRIDWTLNRPPPPVVRSAA